jgi:hypothetical protein
MSSLLVAVQETGVFSITIILARALISYVGSQGGAEKFISISASVVSRTAVALYLKRPNVYRIGRPLAEWNQVFTFVSSAP